jgi:tetratricopeptide (TPR) repeat protein
MIRDRFLRSPPGVLAAAAVVAISSAAVLTGCGGAHSRFSSHLQRGQEFLAQGNLDKASVEFRNAAQIEPKNPQGLYFNGRVAEARSNIRDAYGYYQAAVEADGTFEPARAAAGKMLIFAGGAKRALDLVEPGLTAQPDNAELLAVRAAAHQQLKERDAALADAERAVKLDPNNENALAVLAALYSEAKDYPRAISLISAALVKSPTSLPLHEILTNVYLASGDAAQAEGQIRKIIELQPHELAPRTQLAMHLMRRHDLDGAQKVLEDAVQTFDRDKQRAKADSARLMLVDFVSKQRSREQAERTLRQFIAQDPQNFDLRLGLGALLQRNGAIPEARAAYQDVIQRDGTGPKGLMARDRIAAIEIGRGNPAAASRLIAQVLQKNPHDDDALILRSTLEIKQNDPSGAIADLRAVLRNQPNSVALQRSLAAAYVANRQPALAEETLQAALKIAPKDVGLRVELAQLLSQTNRAGQAVTMLEDTVERAPDDLAAREMLIKAYLGAGNLQGARTSAQYLQEHQPGSAGGFYYAGLIAAEEKHLDESQRELETALRLQPDRMEVLGALVRVLTARGAFDTAISTVKATYARTPANVELPNLLGELYVAKKDFTSAAGWFTRAAQQDPRGWLPHRNLARVRLAMKDPAAAADEYAAALKLAPTEPLLVPEAAQFYEQQGKIDVAVAGYESLYKGNPRAQQLAANNLAMLLVTYRTDQASLDRARDLTSAFVTSNNGMLLDTVGWVRFKRGEFEEALPTLERAVERAPDARVIRYHLAMTQLELGLRDRARDNLESVLSGTATFQGADEARTALASLKTRA